MSGARTVLAFLIAPLAIPVVFLFTFFVLPLFSELDSSAKDGRVLAGLLIFSIYGMAIAYLCELMFGIAAWKIFRRFDVQSPFAFAIAGAVMGWLFNILMSRGRVVDFSNPYFWISLAAGMCSTILFRLVVFSGNRHASESK